MIARLERRVERLEKSVGKEMGVTLSELERALVSLDVCLHPKARDEEMAEYHIMAESWLWADRKRWIPFPEAFRLLREAQESEWAIRMAESYREQYSNSIRIFNAFIINKKITIASRCQHILGRAEKSVF